MKQKFSAHWLSSRQTRKQRKYRYNAPNHLVKKMIASNLVESLREKYGRTLPLRKNDLVLVMRGKFKGKKGKITSINTLKRKAYIEGIFINKKDGTKINVPFDASKLQIQELNLDDKKRIKIDNKTAESKLNKNNSK